MKKEGTLTKTPMMRTQVGAAVITSKRHAGYKEKTPSVMIEEPENVPV